MVIAEPREFRVVTVATVGVIWLAPTEDRMPLMPEVTMVAAAVDLPD